MSATALAPAAATQAPTAPAGLVAGTMVLTLDGELPVQFLAPGDRVITRTGARTLRDIRVTVATDVAMVRIAPSALGHDRPEADLFVVPTQPILVRDWRAKALYGAAQAMVAAARLADGDYIRAERVAEVRLFELDFGAEVVIYASGLEVGIAPACVPA